MAPEYPLHFARFYDLIYQNLRDRVDHRFFLDEIKQTRGKILEIGVGTGRFFSDALDQGADIYGCDLSPNMLEVLRGKLKPAQHFRISRQNIIDFHYDFQFDLIIAPFRVFMHLLDKAEQLQALHNVYHHLNAVGRFIFDVFVPDLKQLLSGIDQQVDFEGEYEPGRKLKRIVSTQPDLIRQMIDVTFRLEWQTKTGWQTEDWTVPMRFFFRYELEHLLERSPFEKYQILGDYQGNELSSASTEFVLVCQKELSA